VRDDGAALTGAIASHVLAERLDGLCIGKVAGDDADVRVALPASIAVATGGRVEGLDAEQCRAGVLWPVGLFFFGKSLHKKENEVLYDQKVMHIR
jgi:hypothetical protein